jgi:hypothetical protein
LHRRYDDVWGKLSHPRRRILTNRLRQAVDSTPQLLEHNKGWKLSQIVWVLDQLFREEQLEVDASSGVDELFNGPKQ